MYTLVRYKNCEEVEIMKIPNDSNWLETILVVDGIVESSFEKIFEMEAFYNSEKSNDSPFYFFCNPEKKGKFMLTLHDWEIFIPYEKILY